MGDMTIKLWREREREGERERENELDAHHFQCIGNWMKLHWEHFISSMRIGNLVFFRIYASLQPLMRFHTSAFTTLSMATSWQFQLVQFSMVVEMQTMLVNLNVQYNGTIWWLDHQRTNPSSSFDQNTVGGTSNLQSCCGCFVQHPSFIIFLAASM